MLFKIHVFSENYTCPLPEEIQSLHWVQETATVYPVVILREVVFDIREDHLVCGSDGCGSQFKCIRAFSSLARRNIKTTRIFCETSHG